MKISSALHCQNDLREKHFLEDEIKEGSVPGNCIFLRLKSGFQFGVQVLFK